MRYAAPAISQKHKHIRRQSHHLASSWPSPRTIKGSFTPGSNILKTANPYLHFGMNVNRNGYFQSAVEELAPAKTLARTERIDVVAGSARKGQSYLFWKGDELFQLPVTFWTETNSWVNSPSYPDCSPHFDKDIIPRCLECTQATSTGSPDLSIAIARPAWCWALLSRDVMVRGASMPLGTAETLVCPL